MSLPQPLHNELIGSLERNPLTGGCWSVIPGGVASCLRPKSITIPAFYHLRARIAAELSAPIRLTRLNFMMRYQWRWLYGLCRYKSRLPTQDGGSLLPRVIAADHADPSGGKPDRCIIRSGPHRVLDD